MADPYAELAKQLEQPQEQPAVEPEAVEEDVAVVEDEAPEPEVAEVDESETDEEAEPEAALPADIDLSQIAEAYGVEVSQVYDAIKVPMPDGMGEVSLGEFKNMAADVARKHDELSSLEKERLELQQQKEALNAQSQTVMQMPETVMQADAEMRAIGMQYQSIDWASLEENDPGKAALSKQNLMAAYEAARLKKDQAVSEYQLQVQQDQQATIQKAYQDVTNLIPAWKDRGQMESDYRDLHAWVESRGYSGDEVTGMTDPNALKFIYDLWSELKDVKKADAVAKKVRKAPLALKPGARAKKPKSNEQLKALINQAKQPGAKGRTKDAAVIAALKAAGVR